MSNEKLVLVDYHFFHNGSLADIRDQWFMQQQEALQQKQMVISGTAIVFAGCFIYLLLRGDTIEQNPRPFFGLAIGFLIMLIAGIYHQLVLVPYFKHFEQTSTVVQGKITSIDINFIQKARSEVVRIDLIYEFISPHTQKAIVGKHPVRDSKLLYFHIFTNRKKKIDTIKQQLPSPETPVCIIYYNDATYKIL